MKKYNNIIVFDSNISHVLMCVRSKDPYKGKMNFVGGKIEDGEESDAAAYRELHEETGITSKDIKITHLMDFTFFKTDCHVEIFVGILNNDIVLEEEKNQLLWMDLSKNFSDLKIFAGEGDISFIMQYINILGIHNIFAENK